MNDIEGHLHGLLDLPRAIGDNDHSWKHALRKHRSNGRSEESKVMLRGDRAATDISTSCRCVYGLLFSTSVTIVWISLLALEFII